MKKIAVIHDLSGLGKCSLTAAIPVISAMGVQACPLPTAVLSNQTGYGSFFWDDYTDRMEQIMKEWKKMDFRPDGLYTGFLAGDEQVEVILKFTELFCTEETQILIDPVMGDQGAVYKTYSSALCEKMRTLVRKADVITPNLTEALLLLYGEEEMKKRMGSYSGTGDLFASVLSAGMVKGISMKVCVEKAIAFLSGGIHDAVVEGTDRNDGICFEKYLGMLTDL